MDPKRNDTTQKGTQAQADAIARQYRASSLAAEAIDNAPIKKAVNPAQTVRSAPSLNSDDNFERQNRQPKPYASIDELARSSYDDRLVQNTGQKQEQKPVQPKTYRYEDEAPDYKTQRRRQIRQGVRDRLAGKNLPSTFTLAKTAVNRAKASTINISFISWAWALWLAQFIFGLIGILSIGIVAGIDSLTSTEGGFFAWITGKITGAIDAILTFIGIDFAEIALYVFIASYAIVISIGSLMISTLYLQYKLAFFNPIFGRDGSSVKVGALLFTFVALATPGLNLLPAIILWMAAVWFYPK